MPKPNSPPFLSRLLQEVTEVTEVVGAASPFTVAF